jgi:hypothetical protein
MACAGPPRVSQRHRSAAGVGPSRPAPAPGAGASQRERAYSARVLPLAALPALVLALAPFHASVERLPPPMKAQLKQGGFWHRGCPVALSDLRLLTVTHYGFDRRAHRGQLVVNRRAARPLTGAFRRLYRIRFPIRHMRFADFYGPARDRPADVTAAFECREAVPSPCTGGGGTGTWSMHAYGLAVDVNPRENPYVGCGQSRDPTARRYRDRSRHRKGMVGARAVRAFRAVGWGWGGAWSGNTKDYMHFSANGH